MHFIQKVNEISFAFIIIIIIIMAASLFSVLHEEHLPADHHPRGLCCAFTRFYFSSEGGMRIPCCLHSTLRLFQPKFELLRSVGWHQGSFPHIHRLMTSLIQKQTTATSPWYPSQNTPGRPCPQHPGQISTRCPCAVFFLFHLPSFLSGIPHSERTGICLDP